MKEKGLYLLLLEARGPIEVGRLGLLPFDGWYVYVGSAQGPGGLKRVERHLSYRDRPEAPLRWHIDALLGCGALRVAVMAVTSEQRECVLAAALGRALSPAFKGFGCSDCSCRTHLFQAPSRRRASSASRQAMRGLGLVTTTINGPA